MTNEQLVLNPAGFWVRFAAQFIDGIILTVPLAIIYIVIGRNLTVNLIFQVISLFYTLVLPILWNGQTVGKKLLKIRIKKITGEKIGLGTMLLRSIVAGLIYGITLGLAVLASVFMVAFRKDKRAVHDLVAGTYVGYDM